MKILFVIPYVPDRIRTRSLTFIRSLRNRGHRVTVMTLWSNQWERRSAENLEKEVDDFVAFHQPKTRSAWNCLRAVPTNTPLQAVWSWNPSLADNVIEVIRSAADDDPYDLIHIEHLRGAKYALRIKSWLVEHAMQTPVVWDSVDCISLLFRLASSRGRSWFAQWVTRFELPRTERFEAYLPGKFDATLATSPKDAQALKELSAQTARQPNIHVITNGIDIDYFDVAPDVKRKDKCIVMTGKMSYHANVSMVLDFSEHIFPRIRAAHPDVEFWVVGKDPTREIRALADDPAIHVTGTVEDIRPYLASATLAVAPLSYAVGVQYKVLEAMACATPVVVSPEGVASLQITSGKEAIVPTDREKFADAVIGLLADPKRRQTLGQESRAFVEKYHSWEVISQGLEELYYELINANRG